MKHKYFTMLGAVIVLMLAISIVGWFDTEHGSLNKITGMAVASGSTVPAVNVCDECSEGFTDRCARDECHEYSNSDVTCYWVNKFGWRNECNQCPDNGGCYIYKDEKECGENVCGLNCEWKRDACTDKTTGVLTVEAPVDTIGFDAVDECGKPCYVNNNANDGIGAYDYEANCIKVDDYISSQYCCREDDCPENRVCTKNGRCSGSTTMVLVRNIEIKPFDRDIGNIADNTLPADAANKINVLFVADNSLKFKEKLFKDKIEEYITYLIGNNPFDNTANQKKLNLLYLDGAYADCEQPYGLCKADFLVDLNEYTIEVKDSSKDSLIELVVIVRDSALFSGLSEDAFLYKVMAASDEQTFLFYFSHLFGLRNGDTNAFTWNCIGRDVTDCMHLANGCVWDLDESVCISDREIYYISDADVIQETFDKIGTGFKKDIFNENWLWMMSVESKR